MRDALFSGAVVELSDHDPKGEARDFVFLSRHVGRNFP
jgi:hypothetical protein